MAVATPEKEPLQKPDPQIEGDPLPYEPPEENFWQRYTWHGELPIAAFATIALHVVGLVILIGIWHLQTKQKKEAELTPVPTRGMKIAEGERGGQEGGPGGGSSEPKKEITEEKPVEQRQIPAAELKKELVSASNWTPEMDQKALETIVQSPGYDKLNKLNDDLKRAIAGGFKGNSGKGNGSGMGDGNGPGPGGKTGNGDASTSGNRSVRWVILFRTNSGKDYLEQLSAFKAKIVVPEPPNWKTNILFENPLDPKGKPLGNEDLPKMYFVDEDKQSASKVSRALGLEFDPPNFIAFFPKDVEEDLAAKERAYRGRQEHQIYSTTFRVLQQNGKLVITVTDQIANKK